MTPTRELPLFPLQTVLFPGGTLPLKIFEQRYLDMATACLRDEAPFGICLIAEGAEVGRPAVPHEVGTVARIVDWDMAQLGVLQVVVQGDERFRVVSRAVEAAGLIRAQVAMLPLEPVQPIPGHCAPLVPLLRAVLADLGERAPPPPHRLSDAAWVGYRWCEVLPIPMIARQKLLELEDSVSRLEIVFRYLEQRGLVK